MRALKRSKVDKMNKQLSNLQGSPFNSPLSNAVVHSIGREYAVFALMDMERHINLNSYWFTGDVLSLQTGMKSASQKTD